MWTLTYAPDFLCAFALHHCHMIDRLDKCAGVPNKVDINLSCIPVLIFYSAGNKATFQHAVCQSSAL